MVTNEYLVCSKKTKSVVFAHDFKTLPFVCGQLMLFLEGRKQDVRKRSPLPCVVDSFGCCNKLLQVWPIVLEARSFEISIPGVKSRCQQGHAFFEVSSGESHSLPLPAYSGCWHFLACSHIIPTSVPLSSDLCCTFFCVRSLTACLLKGSMLLHFMPIWIIFPFQWS